MDKNPFQITSPEDLNAEETVSLFVDVFNDFHKIIDPGHVFIKGPRGAGKSMMFRYLQPDCQLLVKSRHLNDLPFLAFYIPLKLTNFKLAELKRLEARHASEVLNEHILTTHFCVKIFKAMCELFDDIELSESDKAEVVNYYDNIFLKVLYESLLKDPEEYKIKNDCSVSDYFKRISEIAEELYIQSFVYAKRLSFTEELLPYKGALCDYLTFLFPLVTGLSELSFIANCPIYLLIDDAHVLSYTQAQILNSWVSLRTTRRVSLKISTQYNYKSYYTVSGDTIDVPHDYSEIDMSTVYTGQHKYKYKERIADIVKKRLNAYGLYDITEEEYFPEDIEQENEIKEIGERYNKLFDEGKGRGTKRTDDSFRYARPEYIKSLAGTSKSGSTYCYAGFKQLVHLSSGIVRHFLQPAHSMYATVKSLKPDCEVKVIPANVQNDVVRKEAYEFLYSAMEKLEQEGHYDASPKEDIKKLLNLINGLGGVFRQILLSEKSERRVFSVAFSDEPSGELKKILELGNSLGYFHKSTIGRKDRKSGGRTRLYILSKRLAPVWNLDPTGFSGYLFIKSTVVEEAMYHPERFLRKMERSAQNALENDGQYELFK